MSLYLTLLAIPMLALVYMTLTLLTYGVTASLLYLALILGRHAELYCSRATIVGTLIKNRGLFLIPIYIVLTVLHAGIALSLALNDAVFYTSMESVAIVASLSMLFIFSYLMQLQL